MRQVAYAQQTFDWCIWPSVQLSWSEPRWELQDVRPFTIQDPCCPTFLMLCRACSPVNDNNAMFPAGAETATLVGCPFPLDVWIVVDCNAEINLAFKIGGQSYPIHPLDVTQEDVDSNTEKYYFRTVRVASP